MDRDWGAPDALALRAPDGLRAVAASPSTPRSRRRPDRVRHRLGARAWRDAAAATDVAPIGVGMLGYAFMGKAHANAYKTLAYMTWPPPLRPELVAIAGRNEEAVAEAARRYGFATHVTDWRALSATTGSGCSTTPGRTTSTPSRRSPPREAGKHVICEKPLGRDAAESHETWQRVEAAGVKHMCAFNYRFVPAVRLAREMIEAGELGELHHFRGAYLQEWGATERRRSGASTRRPPARARWATSART